MLFLLIVPVALSAADLCTATVYVVKPDGSGDFPRIQDAIDATVDGDVVELTDGIFTEDGNRDLDCHGNEIAVRSQGGNPEECIIDCEGDAGNHHRAFWFHTGESLETSIEGLTIRNGYAENGGAILGSESHPSIINCIFEDNEADEHGGAIHGWRFSAWMSNCIFEGNYSYASYGGALDLDASFITVVNSRFFDNHGGSGGACYGSGSSFSFTDCVFLSNTTSGTGGGGALVSAGSSSPSELIRCTFEDNIAGHAGGAVVYVNGILNVEDCAFIGNRAQYDRGGYPGGGAIFSNITSLSLSRSTFIDNYAAQGGALVFVPRHVVIHSCTFVGNEAPQGGGALYVDTEDENNFTLENSIIAFSVGGGGVRCATPTIMSISCCDIYGNAGGDWVDCLEDYANINGNFSEDPLFCGSMSGSTPMLGSHTSPYALHLNSPCMPGNHPDEEDCGLIGAHGPGCGISQQDQIAESPGEQWGVEQETTWGQIKLGYW
jgi:hypothetical protein